MVTPFLSRQSAMLNGVNFFYRSFGMFPAREEKISMFSSEKVFDRIHRVYDQVYR